MADVILRDLESAKRRNVSIDEIEHIIKNSPDCYGNTGRYDLAMCVFESKPETWKEIHKLNVKRSCDIHMKCFGMANEMIACAFHGHHHNLNQEMCPKHFRYDVYEFISQYIGKDKFDVIMSELPDFLKNVQ